MLTVWLPAPPPITEQSVVVNQFGYQRAGSSDVPSKSSQ
jgi:hypothetical protein